MLAVVVAKAVAHIDATAVAKAILTKLID